MSVLFLLVDAYEPPTVHHWLDAIQYMVIWLGQLGL